MSIFPVVKSGNQYRNATGRNMSDARLMSSASLALASSPRSVYSSLLIVSSALLDLGVEVPDAFRLAGRPLAALVAFLFEDIVYGCLERTFDEDGDGGKGRGMADVFARIIRDGSPVGLILISISETMYWRFPSRGLKHEL